MTYINHSRRNFLKGLTATSVLSSTAIPALAAPIVVNELGCARPRTSPGSESANENERALFDGPHSPMFKIVPFNGNTEFSGLVKRMQEYFKKL